MQDLTQQATERFTREQSAIYRKWMRQKETEQIEQAGAATDRVEAVPTTQFLQEEAKEPVTLPVHVVVSMSKTDKIARVNALIHSGVRACIAFHNKYFVRIEAIIPSPDGSVWYCPVYNDKKNRTAITVPCNSPIILYID